MKAVQLLAFVDERGVQPVARWFESLDRTAAAKVAIALSRLEAGNFSNTKSVGSGVLEHKIDFGPGYRIYFGRDGDRIVILLGGGSKRTQERDIRLATKRWQEFKLRKEAGEPLY